MSVLRRNMRNGIGAPLLATLILYALVTPARSADPVLSFKGHWHVDLKRSVAPGPMPRSVTLNVVADDGKLFESEETEITADGTEFVNLVHAAVDGKFYPVSGSPGNLSVAIIQRGAGFMRSEIAAPNGIHGVGICNTSSDLNSLICDVLITDATGKNSLWRSVYVRDE